MGKGMRAGKRPKAPKQHGGANMQAQLAQVQQMQKMMEAAQSEIDSYYRWSSSCKKYQ